MADPKLPDTPRNPLKTPEANEETKMFQKDGKLEVEERADEARGHIQSPGRDEGGDGGDIIEKVNEKTGTTAERIEAKGVGHERGVKVRLKQQGMKIFLKA